MYPYVKRCIDFILALIACTVAIPFLLIIAIMIKVDSKGPVFFVQDRVGKHKKIFKMYKFRTMYVDTPHDMPTHLLENPDAYITKVGRVLRKTSLDELPQVIHILKGEMSIVGPRPALWNQSDLIELREKYGANDICPGLTGLAQVKGRDELSIEDKAKYDGEYVKRCSLLFDFMLFMKTIGIVLRGDGIQEGKTKIQ